MSRADPSRLLRWYPKAWRDRYGDEFVALLEDTSAHEPLRATDRVAIACAGLRERVHATHLIGDTGSPAERMRAGTLLVLCAWAVFVVAGASFAKYAERFDIVVSTASRAAPWGAFRAVQISAVVASLVVAVGAVVAIPAIVRFVRAGGWPAVRRPLQRALAASAVALVLTAALVAWAHQLSVTGRNGGNDLYGAAFVVWACACAATLALWTAAAVSLGRRLPSSRRVLTIETGLAALLTAAMLAATIATLVWWSAMAADAPWFLHGTAPGTPGSAFDVRLACTVATMAVALVAAVHGTARATHAALALRRS